MPKSDYFALKETKAIPASTFFVFQRAYLNQRDNSDKEYK